ncbi:MAG: UDP-N-acetylglucosamine 2-epimerase [Methanomicrobiales archaeon]|nr:UDP-N-acetylglucosamine 2-epimerase [Methanomicrobiales archaeon]
MRKILAVSGTRADYGLMRPVLRRIREDPELELAVAATGMHLMPEFGATIDLIERDGFSPLRVEATYEEDTKGAMARFTGECIRGLTTIVEEIRPDVILLLGDRAEMLAGAVVGTYLSIPVAHVHGGEITSTVDEHVRHAITKLAHLHFAATEMAAERIRRMGEDPSRVFVVGAPSLDEILGEGGMEPGEAMTALGLPVQHPLVLVIQHPVSLESDRAGEQMEATLAAAADLGYLTVIVYPNADAGGREMIRVIQDHLRNPSFHAFRNIPRRQFLGLLRAADVLVGNSSTGIIEAGSLRLPAVNIGSRQEGRERGGNVIDVLPERAAIRRGIERALSDRAFRKRLATGTSPYGDGHAGERIVEVLRSVSLDGGLIQKRLRY